MKEASPEKAEFTEEVARRVDALLKEFQGMELSQMRKGEIAARAKLANAKKSLERKRETMREQLKRARDAGTAAWDDAREGVESAWEELRGAVEQAREDFAATGPEKSADTSKGRRR